MRKRELRAERMPFSLPVGGCLVLHSLGIRVVEVKANV